MASLGEEVNRIKLFIHRKTSAAWTGFGELFRASKTEVKAGALLCHARKWSSLLILISSFWEIHNDASDDWVEGRKWCPRRHIFASASDVFRSGRTNYGWLKFVQWSGLNAVDLRCLFDPSFDPAEQPAASNPEHTTTPSTASGHAVRSPDALPPPQDLAPPLLPSTQSPQHARRTATGYVFIPDDFIADAAREFDCSRTDVLDALDQRGSILAQGFSSSQAGDTPAPSQAAQPSTIVAQDLRSSKGGDAPTPS